MIYFRFPEEIENMPSPSVTTHLVFDDDFMVTEVSQFCITSGSRAPGADGYYI